eukprot:3529431-Prymnesium_polylepis.2
MEGRRGGQAHDPARRQSMSHGVALQWIRAPHRGARSAQWDRAMCEHVHISRTCETAPIRLAQLCGGGALSSGRLHAAGAVRAPREARRIV